MDINDRKGLGIELKPSYYRQGVKNLAAAADGSWRSMLPQTQMASRVGAEDESMDDESDEVVVPVDRGKRPKHETNKADVRTMKLL